MANFFGHVTKSVNRNQGGWLAHAAPEGSNSEKQAARRYRAPPLVAVTFWPTLRQTSNCSRTSFLAANSDCLLDFVEEDLAVTNPAARGVRDDRVHRPIDNLVL